MNTLISLLLITGLNILSGEDTMLNTAATAPEVIPTAIAENLTFPDDLIDYRESELVAVSFILETDGSITLLETASDNKALESHITKELEAMQLQGNFDDYQAGKAYSLTLRFNQL